MQIRIATPDDAEAIAAAEEETRRTPGLLVGHPGEIPVAAYRAKIAKLASDGHYIVAEENGRLVGHALLDPMPMRANAHVFTLTIVVHPGHVERGIGRAMLEHLLDWARRDARVGKVELNVRAGNERARRLYHRYGFVEEARFVRRVRRIDGVYEDDIGMAWFPARVTEWTAIGITAVDRTVAPYGSKAMVKNFDHVTIVTRDVETAKRFFGLLGFREDKSVVISGPQFSEYMGVAGIKAEHVTLVLDGAVPRVEVQLLKYHHPAPLPDPAIRDLTKLGFNHVCFAIDDMESALATLKAHGTRLRNEVMVFHDRKLVFLEGPEGITVELAEWNLRPTAPHEAP